MLQVYLASRFSRFDELNGYKQELAKLDVEVTSRWLNGGHEWVGTADEDIPVEAQAGFASQDLEDIDAADLVICFTEAMNSPYTRGGRHVEFGYALAKGKAIIVVGHRENVFYCLSYENIYFCETWAEAVEVIEQSHMQAQKVITELSAALVALGLPPMVGARKKDA
jgi:nucleoside 2-deoxyribosyltransferase